MLNRRELLKKMAVGSAALTLPGRLSAGEATQGERPNILWLTIEDTSYYQFGCYGNEAVDTPNIDRLARRGVQFTHAWSTAPQCSPARSSIISGCYATTYGTDWHRHGWLIPIERYFFPDLMRDAGYYCTNNHKTDYNAKASHKRCWDECSHTASYNSKNREDGQPFFSVFNTGVTHMGRVRSWHLKGRRDFAEQGLDPEALDLPPHVPDLPEMRSDYAFHLEGVQDIDRWVGMFLQDLEEKGLAEDTIVFFYSDHGGCLPRGKGFCYETGLRVPFIVYVPPKWRHLCNMEMGTRTDRLVGFVDLAATVLSLAGMEPPDYMQGRAFMGEHEAEPRDLQFGFRTNQATHYDPIRTVTDGRYKYVRNYIPYQPLCLRNFYQWGMPANLAWDEYFLSGKCQKPAWRRPYEPQATEMLFDVEEDPFELNNLAGDEEYAETLQRLRKAMSDHLRETRDLGFFPDSMRQKGQALFTWVHDEQYPVDELIAAAEMASEGDPKNADKLLKYLESDRPEFRFWGASGFATLGSRGKIEECPDQILKAIDDSDRRVAATAAAAACFLGRHEEGLSSLIEKLGTGDGPAYSALEALSLHEEQKDPLKERVGDLRRIVEKQSGGGRKAASILVNLGELPVSELYPDSVEKEGLRVNKNRRKLRPKP